MEDAQIVQLYWDRSEQAITETNRKYGAYCAGIAYGILQNREDAEETVSDSYMGAWNAMPPHRPSVLATFLGKIVRRIAIDKWRSGNRAKRGGGEIILALEELGECVPGGGSPEQEVQREELARSVNRFLDGISLWERRVFLARYWYLTPSGKLPIILRFPRARSNRCCSGPGTNSASIWKRRAIYESRYIAGCHR